MGQRRIGVAVSDALRIIAQARGHIERSSEEQAIREIGEWVAKEGAVEVVVGLPLNMNGSMGPQAEGVMAFKRALEAALSLPVTTWDERLTSRQADNLLVGANLSRKKRKGKIDSLAAQIILQAYLDSRRRT